MKLQIRECKEAELEHQRSKRQYCHVGHYPGTICIAKEFYDLPFTIRMALLAHEVGHLLGGESEREANRIANKEFRIKMRYKDTPYGKHLEIVSQKEAERIRKKLIQYF